MSENDEVFLNRCFKQQPDSPLSLVAEFLIQWMNPRMLAITVTVFILALPLLQMSYTSATNVPHVVRRLVHSKLALLNFLHRICYSLVLDVALYAAFRQLRPCKCSNDGGVTFTHVGSRYGMPSGDAMAGAIFGAYLFDVAPYQNHLARVAAVAIIPLISMERVVLGYHSIAQVTVGSLLGILLHVYSTRMPQFMIFVDALIQFVLGCVLLLVDPNLVYGLNDTNNLFAWFVWGLSFQVFVLLMLARFYFTRQNFTKLRYSIQQLLHMKSPVVLESEMLLEDDLEYSNDKSERIVDVHDDTRGLSDASFTFFAFIILLAINLFSSAITYYGWLTRVKTQ
jgi:membrane-associated phospholipid phosphatase